MVSPSQGPLSPVPEAVLDAWTALGDHRTIERSVDISATVSTNHVYRLGLSDGHELIAKTTIYGSYVHFRQDHRIITQFIRRLQDTRYRDFLAPVCKSGSGDVFTHRSGSTWVVFYEKTPFYDFLPKVLTRQDIASFGREMAAFHSTATHVAPLLDSSWKSLGSDIATLYDVLSDPSWRAEHQVSDELESFLKTQCDLFLTNAERLGYHKFKKIPVLVDWNIGNFSVGYQNDGFRFFSRWDYDWFRVEPRMLDFYFCARVVRQEGDQDHFTYNFAPFFEERFATFLREYHQFFPLEDEEVLFIKEAYRVFLLNYVVRIGPHFFKQEICHRLQAEAVNTYLPALDQTSFSPLIRAIQ